MMPIFWELWLFGFAFSLSGYAKPDPSSVCTLMMALFGGLTIIH